jgi:hypothetical protein
MVAHRADGGAKKMPHLLVWQIHGQWLQGLQIRKCCSCCCCCCVARAAAVVVLLL